MPFSMALSPTLKELSIVPLSMSTNIHEGLKTKWESFFHNLNQSTYSNLVLFCDAAWKSTNSIGGMALLLQLLLNRLSLQGVISCGRPPTLKQR